MAVPAMQFLFRHVSTLERLDDELEKDLAEWFRGSFLLLLVTANIEAALWHNVIPFPDLLDKHGWLGLGLRIMLAIGVVQLMPDQELFSVIHPGPEFPLQAGPFAAAANRRLLEAAFDRISLSAPEPFLACLRHPGRDLHGDGRLGLLRSGRGAVSDHRPGHVASPGSQRAVALRRAGGRSPPRTDPPIRRDQGIRPPRSGLRPGTGRIER